MFFFPLCIILENEVILTKTFVELGTFKVKCKKMKVCQCEYCKRICDDTNGVEKYPVAP